MTNVDDSIKNIEDLLNYHPSYFKKPPYREFADYIATGYQFVIAEGALHRNGKSRSLGLYCVNYKEMTELQETNNATSSNESDEPIFEAHGNVHEPGGPY